MVISKKKIIKNRLSLNFTSKLLIRESLVKNR